jgi:hypothetical protein
MRGLIVDARINNRGGVSHPGLGITECLALMA